MRDDVFRFKIAADERQMIEALAERDGLSGSDVLRLLVRRAHAKAFGDSAERPRARRRGRK